MFKPMMAGAALMLLAACATAPEPQPEPVADTAVEETYAEQIERLTMERLALEPEGSLPADLQVSVLELEEMEANLFYKVELITSTARRKGQDYVLYGQCQANDLPRCADQVITAARMLKE